MEEEATVFIVDDHPATGHSLSWLLRQAELPVQTFSSGREFLEAYQSGKPGCLVLDVSMPVMTGREVQREFSARGAGLPIIFVAADSDVAACSRVFPSGAFDIVEKPIDDAVLLEHIARAMAGNAKQNQAR